MKKIIALAIATLMLVAFATVALGAEDAIYVSSSLDDCEAMVGSLIKNDTGTVNISGKSLLVQTQNAAYGLNGDPATDKYNASYNGARRIKLESFADGKTLPAGTYTVSIYVYENGNHLGDQLSHVSEIALSFHTADETDETVGYNHAKYDLIKLFKVKSDDTSNTFAKSGVTQKVGTRTWGQYTAEVTITETVSQFAFWLMIDGDVGELATIKTWIDDLSIYNEAGAPETEADTSDTTDTTASEGNGSQSNTTNNNTPSTSVTTAAGDAQTAVDSDVDAEQGEKGCGGTIGAISATLALAGAVTVYMTAGKKKED